MSPEIVGRLRPPRLASAPASPAVGELYADTVANAPFYWNGTAWVAWLAPTVSSLPSSPVDGQECYYVADATNGVVWHLKYRAADASAYKWQFVGGPPLAGYVDTFETTSSTVYVALTTAGPSMTVPLKGDYDIEHGCYLRGGGTSVSAYMSYDIGATAATDAFCIQFDSASTSLGAHISRARRLVAFTAGQAIVCKYRTSSAAGGAFGSRFLYVTPVRVG